MAPITNIRFDWLAETLYAVRHAFARGDLTQCRCSRRLTSPIAVGWRTPSVVVVCGCLIAMISFGPRSSLGFFLTPLSQSNHWGRDVFSMALAIQNLLWGIGQPFAGGIADRFGATRVMMARRRVLCARPGADGALRPRPVRSIFPPAC